MSDHLDLNSLNTFLNTREIGRGQNEVWDEIDSTNTRAALLGSQGAAHGTIVAARQQTAGRGRQGRTWVSPKDAGLYISFLLRPQIALTELPLISLATGSATARALKKTCGIDIGLKWVNDLIYDGKKLGGILAEMPDSKALVIGIGINLRNVERPEEIRARAVSIEEITGHPCDASLIAAELALQIEQSYSLLCKGERTRIINEWKDHSVTLGKDIRATAGSEVIEGTAVDVARDGSLIVRTADGDRQLHAGEISIRTIDGSYA